VVEKNRSLAPRDKRSKLDLELLLLALIKYEISTPYLLQASAGLSPGATIPVLNRLIASGHVVKGSPGIRKRTEYQITTKGHRHLDRTWAEIFESSTPSDMEAIIRTASLAIICGAERKQVAAYLRIAARSKTLDSKKRVQRPEKAISDPARLYYWMRSVHANAQRTSEVQVLRRLASAILNGKLSFRPIGP
jgi:DNA-binding PadR family transcriptional regulator